MRSVIIIGAGALGSHVLLFGRNWDADITAIDFDKVEQKNTQSQVHTRMALRRNKALAMQQLLNGMFGVRIKAVPNKLTEANVRQLLSGADLLLDCTDNIEVRVLIQTFAQQNNIPCLHGGLTADGTFGQCLWTEEFTPDPEGEPGAATCENGDHLPFFAAVASRMAVAAQRFLNTGEKRSFEVALSGSKRVS